MMDQPGILVRILHSIPHVNISFRQVNDTFDPDSEVYLESLGILASIPAALLILSLLGLLLYLLTRCCDRKPRKPSSQRCQNCTLVTITLLCCAAIGLGLYGNDDFHNGLLQAFSSGRQVGTLVGNLRKQTESIKVDLETKIKVNSLEEMIDKPNYNQSAVTILLESCKLVRDNTSQAVRNLDLVLYFMKLDEKTGPGTPGTPGTESDLSLNRILQTGELYESRRWPATLGFLTVLLLLCTILVIGVARRSRCALIFFSVFGLFGIIICWFLAGIYLASSVALGDFCMKPNEFMCRQVTLKNPHDVYYLNCGTLRNSFILRLNESRDCVERARESVYTVSRMSREVYPRIDITNAVEIMQKELEEIKRKLSVLSAMLDRRSIDKHYAVAMKGICGGGLLGLSLMMVAGLLTAFLLTILVYADSHAWIYLTKKQPDVDKSETVPLFPTTTTTTPSATISPTTPHLGTGTINRTLLHHQQNHSATIGTTSGHHRNGTAGLRGLAYSGESPPPGYDVVVHGTRSSGHHTLGRLPSQQPSLLSGPNNAAGSSTTNQSSTLPKSSTAYPICKLAGEIEKSDKDPRDVTNNGFNRFDPKYISIGPKAIRGNNNLNVLAAATANKCATLRHGGRYGGSLTIKGASPSPNLKSAKTPSIATVSKDYCNQSDCSTLPYKKTTINTFTDIPGTTGVGSSTAAKKEAEAKQQNQQQLFAQQQQQHHQQQQQQQQQQQLQHHHQQQQQQQQQHHQQQIQQLQQQHHQQQQQAQQYHQHQQQQQQQQHQQLHQHPQQQQHQQQPSVYSIETSSYRSSSGKQPKGGISILNQPLPEIPQPVVKVPEISKNLQQPLCVSNLNQYRSLQRPSKSQSGQHSASYQLREVGRSSSDGSTSVKVIPPSLPPKNRHKDDQQSSRSSRQSNTQTLPMKSSSLSRHQSSTHSTFGYERGQNMNQLEKSSTKQFDNNKLSSSSQQSSGIPYVEQYKSNLAASKQGYQTQQHQRHPSTVTSSTHHHSHQQNNNLPGYPSSQSSHHQQQQQQQQHQTSSNKNNYDQQQSSNVYYRSLKRGGTHANSDLYSVTEL